MAGVRLQLGKGAYNIAHKTCNRLLRETRSKPGKRTVHASCLSTGLLLGEIQNALVNRASSQQDVTVGAGKDYYTTVNSPCCSLNELAKGGIVLEFCYENLLCKDGARFGLTSNDFGDGKPFVSTEIASTIRAKAELRRNLNTSRFAHRQQRLLSRHLLLGYGQFVFIRGYSNTRDRSEPLYKSKTGYYDILEVSPNATHAQIKTAYYKQSFIYHPDKNAGSEEATTRFSEISEAYNVLGNKALRKRYDRGMLNQSDLTGATRPSAKGTSSSSTQQTATRSSVAGTNNRDVFDFDKFIKAHYSEQFQRDKNIRIRKEEMLRKKTESISEKKLGKMTEMAVWTLLAMALAIMISLK